MKPKKDAGSHPLSQVPSPAAGEQETPRPSVQELWLLKLLLPHDELAAAAALHWAASWLSNPRAQQIVERRLAALKNGSWKNLAAFLDERESPEMRSLVTEAVAEGRKIPSAEQQLADVVLKLRSQFLDRQIATLTQQASRPEISGPDRVALLREQQKLRRHKQSKLSPLLM